MAELTEAVDLALRERYALGRKSQGVEPKTAADNPRGLRARMNRILKKTGGDRREAARRAGIPYSTWNHAMAGRRMSEKTRGKVVAAFEQMVTAPARALRVRRVGLPDLWSIGAVVVIQPNGSRYINGREPGTPPSEIWHVNTAPEWRYFNAEGLDSARIVDAWLTQGAGAATDALLQEIEEVYGEEIGFEGAHVDVAFHHRLG